MITNIPPKPRLFIVEGADSTGKTTLTKFMSMKMHAAYVHASGNKTLHHGMTAYHAEIIKSAKVTMDSGISVVLDRHWPSEWTYGRILRPDVSCEYQFDMIWKELNKLNPTYVFCFSTEARNRQLTDPDLTHPYCSSDYDQVYGEYKTLFYRLAGVPATKDLHVDKVVGILKEFKIVNYRLETDGYSMDDFVDFLIGGLR